MTLQVGYAVSWLILIGVFVIALTAQLWIWHRRLISGPFVNTRSAGVVDA